VEEGANRNPKGGAMSGRRFSEPDDRVVVADGARLLSSRDWRTTAEVAAAAAAAGRPVALLLDCRAGAFAPSSRDAEVLASHLAAYPVAAIVASSGAQYGCSRMLSTLLGLRGSLAQVFEDEESALRWLSARLGAEATGAVTRRPNAGL